jgi:pilus assembly protein CpaB
LRRTSRLLVLFGIGLAVLTFVLIVTLFGNTPHDGVQASPPPVTNVQVVTAAADIPLGTHVTKDMLAMATVPVNAARSDAYRDGSLAIGQIARRGILTGAQVGAQDFAVVQDVAQLQVPAGKRAMAISVGELTGVGKLIYPGDSVDLVITLDEATIKVVTVQPPNKSPYAHDDALRPLTVKAPLLLQEIQVLATIDSPTQAAAPAAGASPAPNGGPTLTGTNKLVILAVTDAQAEAILFARTGGTIDLVLRAPGDAGQTAVTEGVILKTLFDKYGVLPPYLIRAIDAYVPQQP